jgi:hypothetical protein
VEPKVAADMVTYTVVSVSRCQCSSTRQCPHASIMIESVMAGTCLGLSAYNPLNEHERNPNALGASGPCQRRWRTEY